MLSDCQRGLTAMPPFTVRSLPPDQLLAVYPLIREAEPALDAADWVRFARQLTAVRRSGQAGIVAAWRQGRSYPCGLFCYRVDNDLVRGRVLVAEHFVAIDLLDSQAVLTALVDELESLAARLECKAVRSLVHGANAELRSGLSAAGHKPDGSLLLKRVPAHPTGSRHAARKVESVAHHG